MKLPTHTFREYDIRGVADRDLTDETARGIGRGFATIVGSGLGDVAHVAHVAHVPHVPHGPHAQREQRPVRVAVGRDCRLSSDRLFAALTGGLTDAGADVVDIGVGPTPMLYAAAHDLGTEGAVMITGSHNPGNENGFKMMRGKASFFGADIQGLRSLIEHERFAQPARKGKVERENTQERYVEMVTSKIRLERTDVKLVVDAGTGARVGIAYDGDADRLGAVDADGEIVWGDRLMILFSRALLGEHPGAAILGEVKCSQTLYDDIAKHGGRPILWKTGHSLIKTKMKEEGALLAGEMSGHLFFADRYYGYDDAIYASLRLVEILARDTRSLSEMLADVPRTYATPEIRVDCPDAIKFDVVGAVRNHYRGTGNPVIDIDGARISFGTERDPAWGLVRASNTGPTLVMRFEATSESRRDVIRTEVEHVVTEARARLGASAI
jgi:phosphomannomutase/phosphoglucomutase